jgi:argininosuccinate lyase
MTDLPPGYLGAEARITSGPAPELVEAGYDLELGDAGLLHDGLTSADLAHVLALADAGLVPATVAVPLLEALLAMSEVPAAEFPYDRMLGDAYNSRERELIRRAGDLAGWVHLGRTRREAGRIAFRLALREHLLDLTAATVRLGGALVALAERTADTVWADVTYLQPAQPSTFGHYVAAVAEECCRHLPRLQAAYTWTDTSPAGSGAVGGTRLGLDRAALAGLLGFSAVGRNTRDTMWALDGLIDAVAAATQTVLTADRLAEDWLIFTSPGFGLLTLDASMCRASVLMPQKRNPYALSVVRGGASTLVGRLAGVAASARTPSASTDNWLYSYGEVSGAVVLARRLVALTAAVVETVVVHEGTLAHLARDPQVFATDLADEIVLVTGVDYRTAYRVVGRAVAEVLPRGDSFTSDALQRAAADLDVAVPGLASVVPAEVTDPVAVVKSRRESGGSAPAAVRAEMAALGDLLADAERWCGERRDGNAAARTRLLDRAREVVAQGR